MNTVRYGLPVGGQALPNGVLMRDNNSSCICIVDSSASFLTDLKPVKHHHSVQKPIIRGIYQFLMSVGSSLSVWRRLFILKKTGVRPPVNQKLAAISGCAMFLFIFLGMSVFFDSVSSLISEITSDTLLFTLLYVSAELLLLAAAFWLLSCIPAIRRTLGFHGAEHKTINCYEQGLPLTVENVRQCSRFHRRCGTSMSVCLLLLMLAVSLLIPPVLSDAVQLLIFFAALLLSVGIVYETMCAKKLNLAARLGLFAQRVTTREPNEAMILCAISALNAIVRQNTEG